MLVIFLIINSQSSTCEFDPRNRKFLVQLYLLREAAAPVAEISFLYVFPFFSIMILGFLHECVPSFKAHMLKVFLLIPHKRLKQLAPSSTCRPTA